MRPLQRWRTLESDLLLDRKPWAQVYADTVELPDGRIVEGYLRIRTPSYVMILPQHENGSLGFVRSYKRGIDSVDIQPPAGIVDPGEGPHDTAKRELLEELGCEAPTWHELGQFTTDGNFGMSRVYFYLAVGCREVRVPKPGDLEEQQVMWLTLAEARRGWTKGDFKQLSTVACLGLAFAHLDRHGRADPSSSEPHAGTTQE